MVTKIVTKDFLRAKFLVDILPVLLSKQEKKFILELNYNYVNVTYKETIDKFVFTFFSKNELFEPDFSYFSNMSEIDFSEMVRFTIADYIMI